MNQHTIVVMYKKMMKDTGIRNFLLMIGFLLTGLFIQCSQPKAIMKTVSSGEVSEMIKNNSNNTRLIILDVRTPDEFAEGHIANATNIDVNAGDFAQKISKLDKTKKYIVYCRSGHRSAKAAEIMKNQSFKTIYNLDGGITHWISDHNPVIK